MSRIVNWREAPRDLVIRVGEVHVWLLTVGGWAHAAPLPDVLSADEVERAARFHFSRDRERFVRARVALRKLLGQYLGADPAGLRFQPGEYGKPGLAGGWEASGINFNLSHSHDVVLYAFARGRAVGIDVERVRPEFECEDIAARFFAAPEVEALRRTSAEECAASFFSCWTRKEAYVKGTGAGLSLPLDSFSVPVDVGAREVTLDVPGDAGEVRRWTIISLTPAAGYVAAVAAAGAGPKLNYWRVDL